MDTGRERREIKCPWCEEVISETEVKVEHRRSDYGTVLERRCAKCGKVLAAYLDQEGDFLPRIRKF